MYSTTSELTKKVCNEMDFIFDIHFVKTMKRNGKVYVKGTCGKPMEFHALKKQCEKFGYIYR